MQCPGNVLIDSTLLQKDEKWSIPRHKPQDQLLMGGVTKDCPQITTTLDFCAGLQGKTFWPDRPMVLQVPKQRDMRAKRVFELIQQKIGEHTSADDRITLNAFRLFGRPHKGVLRKQDIVRRLCDWGINPTNDELNALFKQWDSDGNGVIDFYEFVQNVLPKDYTAESAKARNFQDNYAKYAGVRRDERNRAPRIVPANVTTRKHAQQGRRRLHAKRLQDPAVQAALRLVLKRVTQVAERSGKSCAHVLQHTFEKTADTQYTREGLDRALRRALKLELPQHQLNALCEAYARPARGGRSSCAAGAAGPAKESSTTAPTIRISMLLETLLGAVGTGQTFNTRGHVGANGGRRGDGGGIVAGVRSGGGGEQALGLVATTHRQRQRQQRRYRLKRDASGGAADDKVAARSSNAVSLPRIVKIPRSQEPQQQPQRHAAGDDKIIDARELVRLRQECLQLKHGIESQIDDIEAKVTRRTRRTHRGKPRKYGIRTSERAISNRKHGSEQHQEGMGGAAAAFRLRGNTRDHNRDLIEEQRASQWNSEQRERRGVGGIGRTAKLPQLPVVMVAQHKAGDW